MDATHYRIPREWNDLTQQIIGAAMRVHTALGPGLLEKLYEDAVCIELTDMRIPFERQKPIRLEYRGRFIGDLRVDLVVNGLVVVELKAIERILEVHKAQLLSYLRSCGIPLGLLINFNHETLREGLTRRLNDRCDLVRSLPRLSLSPSEVSADSEFPSDEDRA
jgi:GxxExxY protein